MLAQRLLVKLGHYVITAADGNQAVALSAREPVDLILIDLQMPGMDGIEATGIIRAREKHGGPRMPIVALTAHAMDSDRHRCLAAGMDGYLTKPIHTDELQRVLEKFAPAPQPG